MRNKVDQGVLERFREKKISKSYKLSFPNPQMTSSWHHPWTVTEWGPENRLRVIFFSPAGYLLFLPWKGEGESKEGHRLVVSHRDEQDLGSRKSGVWLFGDCKWEDASRFRVLVGNGKEDSLFIWLYTLFFFFFFTLELCCKAVGFCALPLVGRGIEMFTWGLFHLVNLGSFPCIFCETLFHTDKCIQRQIFKKISTIYCMAKFHLFKKHPWSSCFQTPLLRKKSLHPVRAGRYF